MIRSIPTVLVDIAALSVSPCAQRMPRFSGVWELDTARSDDRVYGQLRVISPAPSEIHMTVFHVAGNQTSIIPWDLPFDRWRRRRGGDVRFRRGPGAIGVMCAAESCNVIDIVAGRRANSRRLASGREAIVSLRGNTLITAARD